MEINDITNNLISMCCSYTKCERYTSDYFTCGGRTPRKKLTFRNILIYIFNYLIVIQNISVSYDLPIGMLPVIGRLNQYLVENTERIVRENNKFMNCFVF
jgi:hypothetical protein